MSTQGYGWDNPEEKWGQIAFMIIGVISWIINLNKLIDHSHIVDASFIHGFFHVAGLIMPPISIITAWF